jgi:hypothetical protein
MFGNKAFNQIFGHKKGEVSNSEYYISWKFVFYKLLEESGFKWTGYLAEIGQMRNAYRLLLGKPLGKRPFGRPRSYKKITLVIRR